MLEYLFVVCQYMDGDNPVMRRVEVIKSITICESGIKCGDGLQVVFARTKPAVNVRETECLYITKENKNVINYQE